MSITKYSAKYYKGEKNLCKRISKNTTLVQLGRASLKKWQCCWKQKDVQVLARVIEEKEEGSQESEQRLAGAGGKREQEAWSGTEGGRWDGRMVRDGRQLGRQAPTSGSLQPDAGPPVWGELVPRGEWHHLTQFLRDDSSILLSIW